MRIKVRFVNYRYESETVKLDHKEYSFTMKEDLVRKLAGKIFLNSDYYGYMIISGYDNTYNNPKEIIESHIENVMSDADTRATEGCNYDSDRMLLDAIAEGERFLDSLKEKEKVVDFEELDKRKVEEKGEDNMLGLEFGIYGGDEAVATLMGIAVKGRNGKYTTLDKEGKAVDSTAFVEGNNIDLYMIPVAYKDIEMGDVLLHDGRVCVTEDNFHEKDGRIRAVDVGVGEEKVIIPAASPFGFHYCTKLVSMFDLIGLDDLIDTDDESSLLMMAMMFSNKNSDMMGNMDMNSLLPLMLMKKDNGDTDSLMKMMMFSNMSGGDMNMNSLLPLLLLK